MTTKETRIKSEEHFHALPNNFNCAQAVLKGFQNEFGITDNEIEEYRAWGGGRAEGGVCGAIFAAKRLLKEKGIELSAEFDAFAGGHLCTEIKGKKFTCAEYVRIADELVAKYI